MFFPFFFRDRTQKARRDSYGLHKNNENKNNYYSIGM